MKQKKAENLGIKTKDYSTDSSTTKDLVELINQLNEDNSIDGILVQRPLPDNIDELAVLKLIDEQKDVDGLNYTKQEIHPPAVVTAIMEVLFHYNIELTNKKITIINNSLFLGKPLRKILDKYSTNVVNCNTKTENIKEEMQTADILILAINKPNFIKMSELKDNVVVIDAGYNKENASSLELDQIKPTQRYTPVPKGIGPITIIKLYDQLLEATKTKYK